MAWAFVQALYTHQPVVASSVSGAQFAAGTGNGNLLVASMTWGNATAGSTYVDTQSNTYVVRKEINDGTNTQSASIASAFSSNTTASSVTGSYTSHSGGSGLFYAEYSGISAFDVATGQVAAGSTAANNVNSTLLTTTAANDLLVGVVWDIAGSTNTITAQAGFNDRVQAFDSSNAMTADWIDGNIVSAASTRAVWTQKQAHRYIALAAAFKQTASGAAVLVNPWSLCMTGVV